ncbi:hypothetical protein SNN53_004163 [Cronobacter sakazakii]|uniref:hypothetical protein n=1 Tax=Cronobacter sakazakii TaxID=28141 RepID=UPI0015E5E8FC|nr:hypothetical protein [Cronobacter sakazakii]EJQ2009545.1 hypothetical protein [Cronobacter sakazakii]EJQ2090817.1 hypothetical protein [Cronobacter sakazakii]EJR9313078.1 hypothetical protein [Cronobacter sakazakii]EJR9317682.1 hypothetical protein [Cronobacter sakazakii]EJR9322046.1 hypothetical protein [Cronobacter sakazakii]
MVCNKNKLHFFALLVFVSLKVLSKDILNPQFSDYLVSVSNGPFESKIHFNQVQETYSEYWKSIMQEQLNKPVNFAGHFRIYTTLGGHGRECAHSNWVCGWVIDKKTGEVVATLPADINGNNSYYEISDNGTSVGLPFAVDAFKNSSMIAITGQPIPKNKIVNSVCKTTLFNFNNGQYIKLLESIEGCND